MSKPSQPQGGAKPVRQVSSTWLDRLHQLLSHERITRLRNMARLLAGLWVTQRIHLSPIAVHLPWAIQKASAERRLSRFLHNKAVRVRAWYGPVAQALVQRVITCGQEVRLVLDTTAVHHRAQFQAWGWDYVLRQRGSTLVYSPSLGYWTALEDLVTGPGQSSWYEGVLLTEKRRHRCNVLIHWEVGEREPWLLATSYATRRQASHAYRRRMWIEETYRDLKSQGFHLNKTHLWDWRALSRLFLALVLLSVWSIAFDTKVLTRGWRYLVAQRHRRDMSLFRIGYDMLMRHLALGKPIHVPLVPYFR